MQLASSLLPGDLVIDEPESRPAPCEADCCGAHSWTADGRRVCWRPGRDLLTRQVAIDAEVTTQSVPSPMQRRWRLSREDFWASWTRAEVQAKLHDVPILAWLTRHGLTGRAGSDRDHVQTWSAHVDDLTICVGVRHRRREGGRVP